MLCSISPASFASEPWNALKTNFQHVLSQLENTFLKQVQIRWKGSLICAGAQGFFGRIPKLLFKQKINLASSILDLLHVL